MGDLRRSSLRRENVEEDREEQARRAQKPFRNSTRGKNQIRGRARCPLRLPLFLPDAHIHLRGEISLWFRLAMFNIHF